MLPIDTHRAELLFIGALLALLSSTLVAPAATRAAGSYYVATTGSDTNDGSFSRPWRTAQKAADTVTAGSTIHLRGGTYPGFIMRRSGQPGAPITFRPYPGERAVLTVAAGQKSAIYIHDWEGLVTDIAIRGLVVENVPGGNGAGAGIFVHNATRVTVHGNTVRYNRSFGLYLVDATETTISGNEITKNEIGIYVVRKGVGVRIFENHIHHNDRMTKNTSSLMHDDYGATGISLNQTSGALTISNNNIHGHRASSYDYGWDGSGIEIWGASNVNIEANRIYNNENVLETGTNGTIVCRNNRFVRNLAYGATTAGRSYGIFLRCAENMLVANNTLYGLYGFAFHISHHFGAHGGAIDGLRVQNNVTVSTGSTFPVYWIRSALPLSVVVDRNIAHNTTGGRIATVDGKGSTSSLATFRSWTGLELTSVQAEPRLLSPGSGDFRLAADSPAIDRGIVIPGVSSSYEGAAPDKGRHERPSSVLVSDAFSRTMTGGWGSAGTGGAYTLSGTASSYDTDGSAGRMHMNGRGQSRAALLHGVAARDVKMTVRLRTDKSGEGEHAYLVARQTGSAGDLAEYRARVRLGSSGAVFVRASRVSGGVETGIGAEVRVVGLSHAAGSWLRFRAEFTGTAPTAIRVRVWANGSAEPSSWAVSVTDTTGALQFAGALGVRSYLSTSAANAPLLVSFDDLIVVRP